MLGRTSLRSPALPGLAGDDDVAQIDTEECGGQFFVRANTCPQGESLGFVVKEKQYHILSSIFLKGESNHLCRIVRRYRAAHCEMHLEGFGLVTTLKPRS